jgi:phage gp29-like protein
MKYDLFSAFATRRNRELSAMLAQLPNPDVVLQKKGLTVAAYSDLLYDAHVSSCIQSRKAGVLSLEWDITNADSYIIEDVKDMLQELDIYQIITDILEATLYGYKPLEVFWRYENNKIIVKDIIGKPSDWFIYDDLNILKFLHKDSMDGIIAPAFKIIVARHNASYTNPYGESVLSRCFWAWFVKKEVFKFWTKFAEKYGMPFMVGKLEGAPDDESLDEFRDALDTLLQDGTIAIPDGKDIQSFQTNQTSATEAYEKLLSFCNAEISKSVLSQTLTTEQGDKGTQALGTVHQTVRKDVVDSDKKLVESVFNTVIKWYVRMNYPDIAPPLFVMFEEEDVDQALATRDKTLADTKQIEFTSVYWQRKYGFKEDEFKMPAKAPEAAFSEEPPPNEYKTLSMFEKSVRTLLKPIMAEVDKAKSFEEIKDKVIEIFPYLDTSEIEELIGQSILASSIQGLIDGNR